MLPNKESNAFDRAAEMSFQPPIHWRLRGSGSSSRLHPESHQLFRGLRISRWGLGHYGQNYLSDARTPFVGIYASPLSIPTQAGGNDHRTLDEGRAMVERSATA